jgi:cytochrome c553
MKPALHVAAALGLLLAASAAFAQAQSGNCTGCHGERGEGNAQSGFPRLAGQSQEYLRRQLDAYADGARDNAIMTPIAKAMTSEQRDAAAAHFAALDGGAAKTAATQKGASARGRTIASVGDSALQIQGCNNCHGPGGTGEPPVNPYLAGQTVKYLQAALEAWKSGVRATDPSGQMQAIGKRLGAEDIAAVSQYYAAQRPPQPARAPQVAAGRRQAPTAPGAGRQTAQGTGTEQGSPTTGGSQGAGGSNASPGG